MMANEYFKEYIRQQMTFMFGSCPLSDDFIDEIDSKSCSADFTIVECFKYMLEELNMPLTREALVVYNQVRSEDGTYQ